MDIILASASPRRKELLKLVVPNFKVLISNVDEKLELGYSPQEQAERLSYIKAKNVYDRTSGDRIIIGSDTIVTKDRVIYGKPKDRNHAKEMIRELTSGNRVHSVITGLCVIECINGVYKEHVTYDEVKVFLKNMSEIEIDNWIESGNAMDKAAAYGIQDEFGVFVEKIDGNYTTVVGLPIHKLYDIMKSIGR